MILQIWAVFTYQRLWTYICLCYINFNLNMKFLYAALTFVMNYLKEIYQMVVMKRGGHVFNTVAYEDELRQLEKCCSKIYA